MIRVIGGTAGRAIAVAGLAALLALSGVVASRPSLAQAPYTPAQKNEFLQTLIGYTGSAMACERAGLADTGRGRIVALIGRGMADGWLAGGNAMLMRGTALSETLARNAEAYRAAGPESDRPDCAAVAERLRALVRTADGLLE